MEVYQAGIERKPTTPYDRRASIAVGGSVRCRLQGRIVEPDKG